MDQQKVAKGLGCFSIDLGLAELVAPRKLCRALGGEGPDNAKIVRLFGVREIATGFGILSQTARNRASWLWARVAGDAIDLGGARLSRPTA